MKKVLVVLFGLVASVSVLFAGEFDFEKDDVRIEFFKKYPKAVKETYNVKYLECVKTEAMPSSYILLGLQMREVEDSPFVSVDDTKKIQKMLFDMHRYYAEGDGIFDDFQLENKVQFINAGFKMLKEVNYSELQNLMNEYSAKFDTDVVVCAKNNGGYFQKDKDPFKYEGKYGKLYKQFEKEWKKKQLEKLED